jgi:hypothetical protein
MVLTLREIKKGDDDALAARLSLDGKWTETGSGQGLKVLVGDNQLANIELAPNEDAMVEGVLYHLPAKVIEFLDLHEVGYRRMGSCLSDGKAERDASPALARDHQGSLQLLGQRTDQAEAERPPMVDIEVRRDHDPCIANGQGHLSRRFRPQRDCHGPAWCARKACCKQFASISWTSSPQGMAVSTSTDRSSAWSVR